MFIFLIISILNDRMLFLSWFSLMPSHIQSSLFLARASTCGVLHYLFSFFPVSYEVHTTHIQWTCVSVFLYAVSFSTALAFVHGTHDMLKHHACGSALTVSFIFFHFLSFSSLFVGSCSGEIFERGSSHRRCTIYPI